MLSLRMVFSIPVGSKRSNLSLFSLIRCSLVEALWSKLRTAGGSELAAQPAHGSDYS